MTTLGKYDVLFPLSVPGQTSNSYLGTQRGFGGFKKLVLLREVLPELQGNDQANQIFLKEAKAVAQFHHPNVADVFDVEAAEGKLILSTEFIPGATLDEVAAAFRSSKLRIPLGMVLMAVRDTALALHYAHSFTNVLGEAQPVLHGTVSPKTIQITFEGLTKVLDFARPRAVLLQRSAANDLMALGATVHSVLAENPQDAQLASRTDLTADLRTALARLVTSDPQHRFPTGLDFAKALEASAAPVIWRPEQAAQLIQRMFTERRDEFRQLLAQLEEQGSSTAVMPLSKIFSEGTAPRGDDPPTIPPGTLRAAASSEGGPDTLPPDMDVSPEDATNPRATIPRPGGLTEAEMQTVVRRSGEQRSVDMPEALGDRDEPSTDVRQLPQPRRSGEVRKGKGGSKLLRLLFVAVLVAVGLVLVKWRTDPEWIRARNPQLAHSLERLAFIPGFPKALPPPPPSGLEELEDAGVAADAGEAEEAAPAGDAGAATGKKGSPDAGAAKGPAKPPPPPPPHHPHHGR